MYLHLQQYCPALKCESLKRNPKHDDAFINTPDFTQIPPFSPQFQSQRHPPNLTQLDHLCRNQPHQLRKQKHILSKEKLTIEVSDISESDTSSVGRSKRQLKMQTKTPTSQSLVENIQNTEGFSTEPPISDNIFYRSSISKKSELKMVYRPKSKFASEDDCVRS